MNIQMKLMMALGLMILSGSFFAAQSQQTSMFVSRQCNENAIELLLDPGPFQDFLGSEFSLFLEEGKARVLIVVHDCSQIWLNGEEFGPAQEVRVWVAIHGSGDIRPVVGAEFTRPTQTWYSLYEGTSNPRILDAKTTKSITERQVDSLFLDPPGSQLGGRVYLNGNMQLSWQVPISVVPSVSLVGVNHDVYRKDSTGAVFLNQIQVLLHVSANPSSGTLEIENSESLVPLLKPGTYPVTVRVFFPIWSRATCSLTPAR